MDNSIKYINLNELIPGEFQPHIEETKSSLENLTNSIKNHGIIIPLIVRPKGIQYEIILGNRRYNAARILRIEKVPVIILDIDDTKAINLIISDNIQRKELTGKEEGYLYEKALEYPNINAEKLSMTLGVPLDRITSKLNLLKREDKKEPPKLFSNQNKVSTNSQPNFINNDIINLADLDKKEKERDEFNMNNNQFINNEPINNNNNNQGVSQQTPSSTEPTFGRRFFPSLEDEPTNMNLNTGIGNINIPNNMSQPSNIVNSSSSSFIDLTDTSHEPTPVSNANISNLNPPQDQQINIPKIPENPNNNSISNEIPQQNINNNQNNIALSDLNSPNMMPSQPQNLNSQLNQPINNNMNLNSTMNNQQPIDIQPSLNMDMPSNLNQDFTNQPIQEQNQSVNMQDSMQMNPTNNIQPNIDQMSNYNVPPIEQPNINEPISMPDLNVNSMPDLNEPVEYPNNLDSQNIQDNQPIQEQEVEQKNVIPIVNMIKDLAINIESLGYKLEITEDDNQNTYKITIEVEK